MKPRDPIERELLRQQGDPIALAEDPGWLKIAGSRNIPHHEPLEVNAYRAWLKSETTAQGVGAWIRYRTELRQRVDPALPPWRDQVRWAIEYALLQGPGDPYRRVYLSELALTRAVEFHDRQEEAEYRRLKAGGSEAFVVGSIHWQWILDWVGEHLPFPDCPPLV
jgi:hypothetical protein